MKISATFHLLFLIGGIVSECDMNKYKKIGCFKRGGNLQEVIFDKTDERFDLNNYQSKLPQLVCECFELTKDNYKYFAVGKNGHCFGGQDFQEDTEQSSDCVGPAEHHQGGLESAEYVYQIKADAATPKDGGASDFRPWGECSASCGGGKRSRERACVSPLPNDPGEGCEQLTEVENCNMQPCVTDSETVIKCEGKKVSLSCQNNWKIKVDSANYGRTSEDECTKWYNIHWSTNCRTGEDKVKSSCDGKQECEVNASNDVFGDPCKMTAKYLEVTYHCEGYNM